MSRMNEEQRHDFKMGATFFQMAELVGSWSKDPSTQVGAVITKQNRIVSVGFNGYPHGISDSASTDDRDMKYLKTLHAEENAICLPSVIWMAVRFTSPTSLALIARPKLSKLGSLPYIVLSNPKIFCHAGAIKSKSAKTCSYKLGLKCIGYLWLN